MRASIETAKRDVERAKHRLEQVRLELLALYTPDATITVDGEPPTGDW